MNCKNKTYTQRLLSLFIGLGILLITDSIHAQQLPQFALTPWSLVEMNPAATGMGEDILFSGAARRQWNSLPGSPSGYHISAQMPFAAVQSGFGISLMQDQIGALSNLEATLLYSYHLQLSRSWTLHTGLSGGFLQSGLDGGAIRTPDGQYQNGGIDHQDGKLPSGSANAISPLIHGGVMVSDEQWRLGVAWRYAQGGELSYSGSDAESGMQLKSHAIFHGSWRGEFGDLEVFPTTFWATDFGQWQATTQCFLTWRERFILGGGYRGWKGSTQDALLLSAGIHVSDRFLLIYVYESGLSALKQVHNGSFELMIQYRIQTAFNKGKLPGIIYNPRFL